MGIVVAFGGKSVEHDISILSAIHVIKSLKETNIIVCYENQDGMMKAKRLKNKKNLKMTLLHDLKDIIWVKRKNGTYLISKYWEERVDFVYPCYHGGNGENGAFSGFLTYYDVPFAFADCLTMACIQDKEIMKQLLQEYNIPTLRWFCLHEFDVIDDKLAAKLNRLGYPLILKGASLGSSIAIKVVHDFNAFKQGFQEILVYDHKIIVERYIANHYEYQIALLGKNNQFKVSNIEMIETTGVYDFERKYLKHDVKQLKVSEKTKEEIIRIAKLCMEVFQVSGMVRIDFIADMNNSLYVMELNAIPGSYACDLWERNGIALSQVLDELKQIGLSKYQIKNSKKLSYQSEVLVNGNHKK